MPAVEDGRHDRTGDVVPEGEDGRRQRRERVGRKVHRGERNAEARILHADFDREALALREIHAANLGDKVAEKHPEAVVKHDDGKDERARRKNLIGRSRDDRRHDQNDRHDGHHRQHHDRRFDLVARELMHEHAEADRHKHDLNDRQAHRHGIDRQPLTRK